MNNCLPRDITTDAGGGKTEPATGTKTVRRLIVSILFTAATLDLTRCGLVMAAARHPAQTAGLVTAGLAAAALTARTARGCQADQRWAGWAALLIGVTSARVPGTGSSSVCEHSPGTKRVSSCTGPTRPELRADRCRRPTNREEPQSMRKTGRALMVAAMAAVVAGMSTPALAATARPAPVPRSAIAFTPGSGQSVVDWNRELITILGAPGAQPATVHPTRNFALLQAAEYDAVTSITHAGPTYIFSVPASRGARPDAAADQAAHDVLTALYPTLRSGPDQLLAGELAAVPDSRGKQQGIRVGEAAAKRLIEIRSSDGSAVTPPPFVAGNRPGDYRPTPPNFPAPVFTNWGSVAPWVLGSGRQFRPAAPPPITGAAYARALNQVKSLGQDSSTTRTADQTTLAKFWGAAPIWNVWNQIAQKLAVTRHASLEDR